MGNCGQRGLPEGAVPIPSVKNRKIVEGRTPANRRPLVKILRPKIQD
jgi:hypothetical protein